MRIAFVGAGEITVMTAKILISRGHEVVVIEKDQNRVDELSEDLDCSFLCGDGSNPAIQREVSPEQTDVLFSLTDNTQTNLIASLVGRSLGFKRVVTAVHNPEFEDICRELGLEDTIVPSRMISRYLADMVKGVDVLELSTMIRDEARFFTFIAGKEEAGKISELKLPRGARVVCFYREGRFSLSDGDDVLKKEDEVVILTHSDHLKELRDRWKPKHAREQ